MINLMEKEDREETRQMIQDLIGKPLAELNGQMRLLVIQNANIETQTIKTNGRVSELENWQLDVVKVLASELPHSIAGCPQEPALVDIKKDIKEVQKAVNEIKVTAKTESTIYTILRSNITLAVIIIGLIVNILLAVRNNKKNDTQIRNQNNLREEIIENVLPTTRGGVYVPPAFRTDTTKKK